ncbi:MAG: hypothetical protein JW795_04600 [Chitinivibrionales bacterium]|nr:hypothetical protein [Chitinivibrionales bacterium]
MNSVTVISKAVYQPISIIRGLNNNVVKVFVKRLQFGKYDIKIVGQLLLKKPLIVIIDDTDIIIG